MLPPSHYSGDGNIMIPLTLCSVPYRSLYFSDIKLASMSENILWAIYIPQILSYCIWYSPQLHILGTAVVPDVELFHLWGTSVRISGMLNSLLYCISVFMFTQCIDSLAHNLVFLMSIWLLYSGYRVWCCNCPGMITQLTFKVISSIIASSSLNIQYCLMSCLKSFLLDDQPLMMYSFSSCKWHVI